MPQKSKNIIQVAIDNFEENELKTLILPKPRYHL